MDISIYSIPEKETVQMTKKEEKNEENNRIICGMFCVPREYL